MQAGQAGGFAPAQGGQAQGGHQRGGGGQRGRHQACRQRRQAVGRGQRRPHRRARGHIEPKLAERKRQVAHIDGQVIGGQQGQGFEAAQRDIGAEGTNKGIFGFFFLGGVLGAGVHGLRAQLPGQGGQHFLGPAHHEVNAGAQRRVVLLQIGQRFEQERQAVRSQAGQAQVGIGTQGHGVEAVHRQQGGGGGRQGGQHFIVVQA